MADALLQWRDFFAAVAGLSGTLLGLLFVALGLNPAIMADKSPAGMRVLAGQTFHSFLVLLVIGLVGLVPDDAGETLMITLVINGVQGLGSVALGLRAVRADPDPQWSGRQAIPRIASPAAAYLISLWVAYAIWMGNTEALGWLVGIVLFLMMSAASSCWDMLGVIGERSQRGGS